MDFPLSSTYGIRSELFLQSADDYHRQRHRVNKKLNRLRRTLKIVTKDTKNYLEKEKVSSLSNENYDMEPMFGDILLFQAERDLLYAQETRLLLDVHTSKSKERFLISKLKKSLKTSKHLLDITVNEQDEYKLLEILVYAGIIEGSLAISKKKYDVALYAFSVVRCSLQFLYTYQKFPSELYTKELYYDIIDLIVDPALKVAALQINKNNNISDLTNLSKEQISKNKGSISYFDKALDIISKENKTYITPSEGNEDELLKEIQWGSYNATINSNEVSLAIMKIKKEMNKIVDLNPTTYDSSLLLYQDAIDLHTVEMERNADEDNNDSTQEQYIILTYLKYNYLLLRIRRDITILKELNDKATSDKNATRKKLLESWKDCLKLNDGILLSINELKELPGIANDDSLVDILNTLDTYFQILKQMKLSKAYLISNEYVKSLALINNCHKLITVAKPFENELEGTLPKNKDLQEIRKDIEEEKSKVFILASHFKDDSTALSVGSKYVIDNIKKLPEFSNDLLLSNVAPLDIDFQPVNVKPVLFDIAYNYIQYGSNAESIKSSETGNNSNESVSEDNSEKKKAGFFGLFGR